MRPSKWNDLRERLDNYVATQREVARKNGTLKELENAKNLTQARQIVYGKKVKPIACQSCGRLPKDCVC